MPLTITHTLFSLLKTKATSGAPTCPLTYVAFAFSNEFHQRVAAARNRKCFFAPDRVRARKAVAIKYVTAGNAFAKIPAEFSLVISFQRGFPSLSRPNKRRYPA